MEIQDLMVRAALALGIGLLIGLERGWRRREAHAGSRAAGIRTFAISGLLGGVVGAIARSFDAASAGGGIVLAIGLAAYSAVITVFCRDENKADGRFSATTAIAGVLTFALGAYAFVGDIRIAAAVAVATTGILAAREELHGWVRRLTWPELRSGLVLLTMTCIALPIVPDDPIGPFGGVNPREVWIIAIILAGVSFLGYAAVKYLGTSRGVLVAAAAGGLASSTAVTVTNARRAAAAEGSPQLLAAGVALASAVMFLRVIAIVIAMKPNLLVLVAPALVAAAATAAGIAVMVAMRGGGESGDHREAKFRNPFGFWSVVGFAVFLGLVIVLGRWVGESFGAQGALIGAVIVGLVDVDSVTVSMARLTPATLTPHDAAFAILAAVASDTVSKIAIGAAIGRGRFALAIAVMAAACLAVGAVVLWATLALSKTLTI